MSLELLSTESLAPPSHIDQKAGAESDDLRAESDRRAVAVGRSRPEFSAPVRDKPQ
jgi:hypothetical protein